MKKHSLLSASGAAFAWIVVSANTCSLPMSVMAQDAAVPAKTPVTQITWKPLGNEVPIEQLKFESLSSKIAAGEVQLAFGEPIKDPRLWESVLVAAASNGRFCTATVIGPNVLLTAAHCVDARSKQDPSKTVVGTVRVDSQPLNIRNCSMPKGYREASLPSEDEPRSSHDFALCEFAGKLGQNVIIESLAASAAKPKKQQKLLLSGYGCINIRVVAGAIDFDDGQKKLRVGVAALEALDRFDATNVTGLYLRTRTTQGEPILCPGDSGGPAFAGVTLDDQSGPSRRVVGVNSKVVAVPDGVNYEFFSFMTSVPSAEFESFRSEWQQCTEGPGCDVKLKVWAARKICGRDFKPGSHSCRI